MNNTPQSLEPVIGAAVFRAWRGYQRSIFFELGEEIGHGRGKFTIGVECCPWRIYIDGTQIITDKNSYQFMDEMIVRFVGHTCIGISLDLERKRTTISFSDNFVIQTSHKEDLDEWYLLTPKHEIMIQKNCEILIEPAEVR